MVVLRLRVSIALAFLCALTLSARAASVRLRPEGHVNAAGRNVMRLERSGAQIRLIDSAGSIVTSQAVDETSDLVIEGTDADDTLVVDFSKGNPVPHGGLVFDGGGQRTAEGDMLQTTGGPFHRVESHMTNAHDGWIDVDGAIIRYTGLEPVNLGGPVADLTLDLSGLADFAILEATGVPSEAQLRTVTFTVETQIFKVPTNSLTIRGGDSDDVIQVDSNFSTTSFNASLILDGQAGIDTMVLLSPLTLNKPGAILTATAETIDLNVDIATAGAQTYNGPTSLTANVNCTAGTDVTFADTVNGAFTLGVNAPGVTTFSGVVGGGAPPAGVSTDAAGSTHINGGSITVTAGQNYADDVVLGANTTLTNTSPNPITFDKTVNGAFGLTVSTGGVTSYNGAVGGITPLTSLSSATGNNSIFAPVTTTGAQSWNGPVTIVSDVTFTSTAGDVTFNQDVSSASASNDLTVNAAGTTRFVTSASAGTITTGPPAGPGTKTLLDAFLMNTALGQTYNNPVFVNTRPCSIQSISSGNVVFNSTLNGSFPVTFTTDGDVNIPGLISGTLSLTKNGTGTMTLSGNNIGFLGPTNINAGTLRVNNPGPGAGTGSGLVTIAGGATIGGTGFVASVTLLPDAILAPGNSIGTLTASGTAAWGGSAGPATAMFELGSPGTSDALNANNLAAGAGPVFKFDFLGTGAPGVYTLSQFTSTTFPSAAAFSYVNLATGMTGAFSLTPTQLLFTVTPIHFSISAPASATAGSPFSFTVTALDASNNVDTSYSGTVHFTSSDGQAVLPGDIGLTNGVGSFSATLKTAGSQTITATDTVAASATGISNPIAVSAAAATHFAVSAPASATAGTAFNLTVTAQDQFNNTDAAYSGTVHFTSTDSAAVLPSNSTLSSGTGTFSSTLKTAGNQTITATDTITPSITGTSNAIAVSAAVATHFTVTAPSTATAGIAFNLTVTAQDQFNNTATGYAGTVHFTSSDGQAVLPADSTLVSGTGTFSSTLKTAGNQTITETDTITPPITGTSNAIAVSATAATHFSVSAPSLATSGVAFSFTVTALDQFNNTATGYAGTVHFTSSDGGAVLPADSTLASGTGSFSATMATPGSQTITATDTVTSSITGTSNAIAVSAGAATHFVVSAPASATAGSAFNFTVTALDAGNNVATAYAGTVHFTSSDGAATLPADSLLSSGVGTFSSTLKTAGSQTITATDTITPSTTGTSSAIAVSAAAATHFTLSAPSSATSGVAFSFTVTALDQFNNTATGYAGTVHFTSTDGAAVLPADSTLAGGTGTFSATLTTSGSQTITATDTVTSSITGTSNAISVTSASATHFAVSAPASATAGSAFSFTVTALDATNNVVTSYAGTVHFTSSDGAATLPADSVLTSGVGTFSATLKTAGNQTITATDTVTPSITGTSNAIAVSAAAATHFTVSAPASATGGVAFNFTVTALDQFDNTATGYAGTVHFTSTDGAATLPANSTLSGGTGTFSATLSTAGSQTITATDTVTTSITGTSNAIAVTAAAAAPVPALSQLALLMLAAALGVSALIALRR